MSAARMKGPPIGTRLEGGYRLTRFLGTGGMSVVYEGQKDDEQTVAIKLLLGQGAKLKTHQERFAREALIAGTIDHDNVVPVLESLFDPTLDAPFLVMPLLSGMDLSSLITRVGALHPTTACHIIRQASAGLQAAHDHGVVHRDIKPGNIFLDHRDDGSVVARLLDFGAAKANETDQNLTGTGTIIGTPVYMAPEHVIDSKNVDKRADIWSIGMTLFYALTGHEPFGKLDNITAIIIAIHQNKIPHIQEKAPWIDPALATIVHGALIPDTKQRCPDAQSLVDALAPFAQGDRALHSTCLVGPSASMRRKHRPASEPPTIWTVEKPSFKVPALDGETDGPFVGMLNQTIGDRFTLKRLIGQGAMGAVFEAVDATSGRYAVKVIRNDGDQMTFRGRQRFIREGRLMIDIDHPHVVRVLHADTTDDNPYLVMELLQGHDLQCLINEQGALNPGAVARLFVDACRAVRAAHRKGIIHRDIKPANIFLHQCEDGSLTVKVCDFGVATRVNNADETRLTRTGHVLGSPVYMSPEQVKDPRTLDEKSDIWSLGITLFQALSGQSPWKQHRTLSELLVAIRTSSPPHLQDIASWVDPDLATIVHRALKRDPNDRFDDAEQMASALEKHANALLLQHELVAVRHRVRSTRPPRAPIDDVATAHGAQTTPSAFDTNTSQPSTTVSEQPKNDKPGPADETSELTPTSTKNLRGTSQAPTDGDASIARPSPSAPRQPWRMVALGVIIATLVSGLVYLLSSSS